MAIVYGPLDEVCPLGLAPSASTTAMIALGDALAFVLSQEREFTHEDFARFHPAGSLGRKLLKVEAAMRQGSELRVAPATDTVRSVFAQARHRGRRTGAVMLIDADGRLCGLFTDSDLARLIEARRDEALDRPIAEVMTPQPADGRARLARPGRGGGAAAPQDQRVAGRGRRRPAGRLAGRDGPDWGDSGGRGGGPGGLNRVATAVSSLGTPQSLGRTKPCKPPPRPSPSAAAPSGLLVLDVDGVLTEGGIVYGTGGLEVKRFHVRDGSGIKLWRLAGRRCASSRAGRRRWWTRGRRSWASISSSRGRRTSCRPTGGCWKRRRWHPSAVCYVGDDVPDLPPLRHCGLAVAVGDGCREARAAAHYVTRAAGGRGAVREVIELILRCQGEWGRLAERLRNPEF